MALLFDEDYNILRKCGTDYEEDEVNRFLIIKNFPLKVGLYVHADKPINQVEVLYMIPPDYNTSGGDMLWVHPALTRADGKTIPQAFGFGGGDSRSFNGKEYCRWSRHFKPGSWKPKVDNIQKILDRIEWALRKPNANR